MARHARALRQVELCLCPVQAPADQGVRDALLDTLVEPGLTDNWQHMIHSTTVRAHSQAAGRTLSRRAYRVAIMVKPIVISG